jgi:type I restriction enzyme S subunit
VTPLEAMVGFNNGCAHENHIKEYGNYTVVNSKFVSTEGRIAKYSGQCLCPVYKNNILMVMSDVPNGKAIAKCFLVDEDDKYTLNQRICAIDPKEMDSKYLFLILSRNSFYLQFDDGAKQTNLRRQDVLDCPIPVPSIKEQIAISSALFDMKTELDALQQRLSKTKKIKQGMMQELLTGKTRLV